MNEDLFTLNMASSLHLSGPSMETGPLFAQSVQGLLAVLLACKAEPSQIRYQGRSQIAQRVASEVAKNIAGDGIFHFTRQEGPMVLVLDRMDDPVTPLLSQWTYQAMVHELLGLNNGRVMLPDIPEGEVTMSGRDDTFFDENKYQNFGDLGAEIQTLMQSFAKEHRVNASVKSIEVPH